VVGKPTPRRDLPDKIAGRPRFIQDMTLPRMLYGRIVRPPHNFAGLISLDDGKVKSMPGLAAIVPTAALSESLPSARRSRSPPSAPFD